MRAHRRLVAHQQLEGLVAGLTVKVEDGHGIAAPIAGTAPAQRSKQDRDRLPID